MHVQVCFWKVLLTSALQRRHVPAAGALCEYPQCNDPNCVKCERRRSWQRETLWRRPRVKLGLARIPPLTRRRRPMGTRSRMQCSPSARA